MSFHYQNQTETETQSAAFPPSPPYDCNAEYRTTPTPEGAFDIQNLNRPDVWLIAALLLAVGFLLWRWFGHRRARKEPSSNASGNNSVEEGRAPSQHRPLGASNATSHPPTYIPPDSVNVNPLCQNARPLPTTERSEMGCTPPAGQRRRQFMFELPAEPVPANTYTVAAQHCL
ncbi:hypothetical protein NLG97_g1229 [Lecanicillium saksenae]|uniref:Uncharacterized protein n=1 Tax=Lecanicillium saksenae TaxID=468837 RepID=A0ACC1R4B2_9HYPO|nr:hypothetical protein NLG97_g1229 [Lecanicillium saksenae]